MNPFDEQLNALPPPPGGDSSKETSQRRWEHKIVGLVLSHFGLVSAGRTIASADQAATGVRGMTFRTFRSFFPTFPFWLSCHKIPYVGEMTFSSLVRDHRRTALWQAFETAEADAPEQFQSGRLAMVFEWLHVWPVAVLHNDYHSTALPEWSFVRHYTKSDPPQFFALQSFDNFLTSLRWSPPQ